MNKVKLHEEICKSLNSIYEKKNADYGDSFSKSFDEYGMTMLCIRLEDKLNRLKSLTVKGNKQEVNDESVVDTLLDLSNYAIMGVMEMEKK
ncbi:MAG: nucleotide modification associated domain-containing protein [Cetobacterium sp.]